VALIVLKTEGDAMKGFIALVFLMGFSVVSEASNLDLSSALSDVQNEQHETYRKIKASLGQKIPPKKFEKAKASPDFQIRLAKASKGQ
jgi:hypothetical protein